MHVTYSTKTDQNIYRFCKAQLTVNYPNNFCVITLMKALRINNIKLFRNTFSKLSCFRTTNCGKKAQLCSENHCKRKLNTLRKLLSWVFQCKLLLARKVAFAALKRIRRNLLTTFNVWLFNVGDVLCLKKFWMPPSLMSPFCYWRKHIQLIFSTLKHVII